MADSSNLSPQHNSGASRSTHQRSIDDLITQVSQQIEQFTFDPNDTDCLRQLVQGFEDERYGIQLRLIELFGEIGEEATPILVECLGQHQSGRVRQLCAQALARLGDPDAVPALIAVLINDPDPLPQSSAVGALTHMGSAAVSALLEVIASPKYQDTQKGQAAWALSCLGSEATPELYAAMASDVVDVRCAVVRAIATIARNGASPDAVRYLLQSLHDPALNVRIEAVSGLGQLSGYNATPQLIPFLTDPDVQMRRTVVMALGELRDPKALPHLLPLETDPSPQVRPVVTWAIRKLERPSSEER